MLWAKLTGIWKKGGLGWKNIWKRNILNDKKIHEWINKPSFCSGSWDEIHATTKLQNKTSLKHSWNTLETFFWKVLETNLTLYWNNLETSLKGLWNYLETHFELLLDALESPLNHHWRFLGISLPWITLKSSVKHPETPLKLSSNIHWTSSTHPWHPLTTPLKYPSIFLKTPLKLSWNFREAP